MGFLKLAVVGFLVAGVWAGTAANASAQVQPYRYDSCDTQVDDFGTVITFCASGHGVFDAKFSDAGKTLIFGNEHTTESVTINGALLYERSFNSHLQYHYDPEGGLDVYHGNQSFQFSDSGQMCTGQVNTTIVNGEARHDLSKITCV